MVLGLGRGRRGLCDVLVAGERKAQCHSRSYSSRYFGEVFPKLLIFLKLRKLSVIYIFHSFFDNVSSFHH